MSISIIIPTYNGANKLPRILDALIRQEFAVDEIIVAVDGSSDNTEEVLEEFKIKLPALKVLMQENKGRSAIRNSGAAAASGDLLVFFDDDMVPLTACIEGHLAHHCKHPGSILTGGLSEPITKRSADFIKYKAYLSDKWTGELNQASSGALNKKSLFITAANFSLQKKTFNDLGGFDEMLRDAEDMDLAIRAYKAGIPLYFDKKVFAWHHDNISCRGFIKRQRQYSKSHKLLAQLRPWMLEENFLPSHYVVTGLKKSMFKIFLSEAWIRAVDNNSLNWLPRKVRYKLYDLIITANGVYFPEKVKLE